VYAWARDPPAACRGGGGGGEDFRRPLARVIDVRGFALSNKRVLVRLVSFFLPISRKKRLVFVHAPLLAYLSAEPVSYVTELQRMNAKRFLGFRCSVYPNIPVVVTPTERSIGAVVFLLRPMHSNARPIDIRIVIRRHMNDSDET